MISPRSMAYSRSATRVALARCDSEIRQDSAVLRRVADAEQRALVRRQPRDVTVAERDPARADRQEAHDAVDGRGLAGAVAADQADRLAVRHPERDLAKNLGGPPERVDPIELERGGRHQYGSVVPMRFVMTVSLRRISSGVPSARIAPWCIATIRSE